MELEKLVDLAVAEIMNRMREAGKDILTQPTHVPRKVLVLFTGAAIGLDTALAELKIIQNWAAQMTVVLSESAEKVIGLDKLRNELGSQVAMLTVQSPYPGKIMQESDVVLVPTLTMNTAAKLASLVADNPVSTLIMQALMYGKPVIAAKNAADPEDTVRLQKGMDQGTPALKKAMQNCLTQIEAFGVSLVSVENLAQETKKKLNRESSAQAKASKARDSHAEVLGKRQVVDAESVRTMVGNGINNIRVPRGTIVTPLALDIADSLNAVIIYDT